MRVELLGHACVRITLSDGRVLVVDPYEPGGLGGRLRYRPVATRAGHVLLTHEHADHTDTSWLSGDFSVHRGGLAEAGLEVDVFHAAHDQHGGRLRGGMTRMFRVRAEGLAVLHCGDLGERLSPARIAALGAIDVLLVPTGGYFTIGPEAAMELARRLAPRFVVPCHYATSASAELGLLPVERMVRRHRGPVTRRPRLDVEPRSAGDTGELELVVLECLGERS